MDTKLTTAQACFELFGGAHICEAHYTNFKRPFITVINIDLHPDVLNGRIGTITEKQFKEIYETGAIVFSSDKKDKYGNIYNFYVVENALSKRKTLANNGG